MRESRRRSRGHRGGGEVDERMQEEEDRAQGRKRSCRKNAGGGVESTGEERRGEKKRVQD